MERPKVFKSSRIKVTEKIIKSIFPERVLEIGSRDYSFEYLKQPGTEWKKADFSPPCDVICDMNFERLILPFRDDAFDLVICTEVLEHLLWPHRLLAEIARVLKPDGQALISVPNCSSASYRIAWLLGRIPSCAASGNLPKEIGSTGYQTADGTTIGGHVIDFNRKRLERLIRYAGFSLNMIQGCGIIWHRQILPTWAVPVSLSSNIICLIKRI